MRKVEQVVNELKKLYTAKAPGKKFLVTRDMSHSIEQYYLIRKTSKKAKAGIASITLVDSSITYFSNVDYKWNKNRTKLTEFKTNVSTGIFEILLTTGEVGYLAVWETGHGKFLARESVLICSPEFCKEVLLFEQESRKFQAKPKPGIFKIAVNQMGMVEYEPYEPESSVVIHPLVSEVENEINIHFKRLEQRKFHDRTLLLYSIPGTGKTELLKHIANKYKNSHCIVFSSDVVSMVQHQNLSAKYKTPTIIFLEEAEEALATANIGSSLERVNSSVKNILSGYLAEKNPVGCFKIFTTNYPDRIDKTIIQRKQRIDKVLEFGALNGNYATDCVRLYLGDDVYDKYLSKHTESELYNIFDGLTGVEIKGMCEDLLIEAEASETELSLDMFSTYKSSRLSELNNMFAFIDREYQREMKNQPYLNQQKSKRLGF